MRQAVFQSALSLACVWIGACAQGGGEMPDGGGMMPRDSGIRLMDSGPPPGTDSGPPDDDAGSMTDAGRDAGPPPVDAGPPPVDAGPPPVDAGPPMCTESPCRLVSTQCGCAPGQACYLTGGGRTCATAGTGGEGTSCTSYANCAAGMTCAAGVCSRFCTTHSDCPGRGSYCVFTVGGTSERVCSVPCEPATGAGCPSGYACRWTDNGGFYYTDCEPEGPVGEGGDCSSSACQANLVCVNIFGDRSCSQICRLDGSGDCPLCIGFIDGTPNIDGTDYGFCG